MPMIIHLLVFGSIAAAVIGWALGEAFRSRAAWTAGALLMVVHSLAAFAFFYDWSHDTARRITRQQTAALTGIDFAGGIYINYLFVAVWLADATWWCVSPADYARRPRWLTWMIRGFICFIIVNGAIVFADGWARILGVIAVAIAGIGALRRSR